MICKWCNKEVPDSSKFCGNCGANLIEQNNIERQKEEIEQEQIVEINNQEPVINTNTENEVNDSKVNVWLVILSILIPLAGLIIFLVKKDKDKNTAKASGIAALISFIVRFVVCIIIIITFTFATKSIIDGVIDNINDNPIIEENNNNTLDDIYNDNTEEENTETPTDWKKYEFTVNGKTLALPTTYSELSSSTGFEMQSSYTISYLQSGYYAMVNMYKNNSLALYTEVLNDSGVDSLYTDCKITRVSQTKYQISVGADSIIFPGGLKAGQEITEQEIINLFGTPDDTYNYESDGYISNTYTYLENSNYTTVNYYEIKVVNGIVDELTLDNRAYNQ